MFFHFCLQIQLPYFHFAPEKMWLFMFNPTLGRSNPVSFLRKVGAFLIDANVCSYNVFVVFGLDQSQVFF